MTLPSRLVSLLLIYCFLIATTPHPSAAVQRPSEPATKSSESVLSQAYEFLSSLFSSKPAASSEGEDSDQEEGLKFRVSEAPDQPEARSITKVASAAALSDAETEAILRRLPPIKTV